MVTGSYKVSREELEQFKRGWPCHGLPSELETVTFDFDRGDLVEVDVRSETGEWLDISAFDGAAMVALSQDAQEKLERL